MGYPVWTVIEVGIDYITATAQAQEKQEKLLTIGQELTELARKEGTDPHPFAWQGYLGLSTGPCTWAARQDSSLLRLSGELAARHWRTVGRALERCTRLDLAVTARCSESTVFLPAKDYSDALHYAEKAAHNGLVSQVADNRGGWTVYIGSRTSPRFARIYNKEAESGKAEYQKCVRWEVEYKQEAAGQILAHLSETTDSERMIRGTVARHFTERGVSIPWPQSGTGVGASIVRSESDDAIRLRWLERQVAPVLGKLHGHGRLSEALTAMGIKRLLEAGAGENPDDGG